MRVSSLASGRALWHMRPRRTEEERTWSYGTAVCSVWLWPSRLPRRSARRRRASPTPIPSARGSATPACQAGDHRPDDAPRRQPSPRLATPHTLAEALAATYSNQPALQAERAKLRATDENVPQALAGWRPTVVMAGTAGYGDGTAAQFTVGLPRYAHSRGPTG